MAMVSICMILLYGNYRSLMVPALIYWNARCLSGITSIVFPKAKKSGMLYSETKESGETIPVFLIIQLILGLGVMFYSDYRLGILMTIVGGLLVLLYKKKTEREFGGVTGDTAGYFITCFESDMFLLMAVLLWVFTNCGL